jgi:ATP-binding cassette, subfamily F, member 3
VLYRLDGVRLNLGGRDVLRGVDLQHNPGEKLILLGRNGSGKTTLIRVVAGELEPDGGRVTRAAGLSMARLEQILTAPDEAPVLRYCLGAFPGLLDVEAALAEVEKVPAGREPSPATDIHALQEEYERLDGYRARPRAQAALQAVGIGQELHSRPLGSLSGGQRSRVQLVRALLSDALLLLDEPTNHLDLLGVDYLASELGRPGRPFLLVTHDRDLVDRVGGAAIELASGRIERYPAGWARYRRERAMRQEQVRRAWEQQQAEIRRQQEFIRRNIAGQNTRQAQARQNLLDRLERLAPPDPVPSVIKLRWPRVARGSDRVLETTRLDVGWTSPVVRDVSFVVRRGERVAIVGRNGSGKSTLVRTIVGRLPALGGGIRFGTGVTAGWYDQDQADVVGTGSALEALLTARPDWAPADARAWAGRFGFPGEAAEAPIGTLSGGERARLTLARLLAEGPNLLLLDEPTNHLDAETCEVLEEALLEFPGSVVLVSHDRRLVERVCMHALLIENGRAERFERVSDAFERLGLAVAKSSPRKDAPGARRSALEEERRRLRRDAGRARENADKRAAELEAAERRLAEVDELLCRREVFADAGRARALAEEAEALRAAIDPLFDAWSEAEEDAGALESRLGVLDEEA